MDENEFFRQTVQHLARCLSSINPTPWEKVNTLFMLCPQAGSSLIVTPRSQEATIALGLYFLQSNLQHQDKLLPYFLKVLKCLTTAQFEEPLCRIKNGDQEKSPNVGIIGGHKITIEDVPYIVSLRINGTDHWCGGSIIHEQFVLTAAHCIVPDREYKVLVGTDKVDEGGKLYDVEKIIIHESYSNVTSDYDICILKLNESLTFGKKVNKISYTGNIVKLKKGTHLNATGWGFTQPEGHISENLQQVTVPVVAWLNCQFAYSKQRRITKRMLCAGGLHKDSCVGDSGGPLTWNNVQVGVTSFGAGCGIVPGVYTKLTILSQWIDDTIKHHEKKVSKKTKKNISSIKEDEIKLNKLAKIIGKSMKPKKNQKRTKKTTKRSVQ